MVPKKSNRVKNSSPIIFKENDTIVFAFVLPKLKNVSVQAYMLKKSKILRTVHALVS